MTRYVFSVAATSSERQAGKAQLVREGFGVAFDQRGGGYSMILDTDRPADQVERIVKSLFPRSSLSSHD